MCAAIAEKGVNNTFIIKSKYSERYEGFAEGEILDAEDFINCIREALGGIISSAESPVKRVYVGVPCEFVETVQTDNVISFQSSQRISLRHLQAIADASRPAVGDDETIIRCGALYYVLSDKRRLVNPLGMVSDSLRARLCFFKCRKAFTDAVKLAMDKFVTVRDIVFLPQNYCEGLYLFAPEERDGYSVLFDFGAISSTFSVICGDGVAFSEAFSIGLGHVAVLLMEALDIPYSVAYGLIKKINLNAADSDRIFKYVEDGKEYKFSTNVLKGLIRDALDGVCGMIETCLQTFTLKDLTGAPVNITGEGVGVIRGTLEHFSSRLVSPVEIISPKLPYYDKPQFSSLFSLLHAALGGGCV